jgi:hypothetical protein
MSLRIKMQLIIVLRITIVFIIIYLWLYNFFTNTSTHTMQVNMETLLRAGTASLNGDEIAALVSHPESAPSDERYQTVRDWFVQVSAYNPQAVPYVYYESAPGRIAVLADSRFLRDPSAPGGYRPGQELPAETGSILWNGLKTRALDLNLHASRSGEAVSGAVPIVDSRGRVVAALAVDMPAGEVAARQLTARSNMLALLSLAYVLLSSSVWFITGNLTRTLRASTVLPSASARVIIRGWRSNPASSMTRLPI